MQITDQYQGKLSFSNKSRLMSQKHGSSKRMFPAFEALFKIYENAISIINPGFFVNLANIIWSNVFEDSNQGNC